MRAALLQLRDARSISKLLLRDAQMRSASSNVLRIVNPSVKLVLKKCVRVPAKMRDSRASMVHTKNTVTVLDQFLVFFK